MKPRSAVNSLLSAAQPLHDVQRCAPHDPGSQLHFLVNSSLRGRQVTKVDMENGTVDLRFSEMIVNNLNLRFVDRKTGESREDGATRPEVILRQLTTRPGQVRLGSAPSLPMIW